MYYSIKENLVGEYSEKKSKFIANVYYINSEAEAQEIINSTKRKCFDAKHNCYAYRVFENGQIIEKMSDDGEPSGTAGAPMMNILRGKNLSNCIAIVTRYFGGILLGTGGLVRAYTEAVNNAFEDASLLEIKSGEAISFEVSYSDLKNAQYYCQNNEMQIVNQEFGENIKLHINMPKEKLETFESEIDTLKFTIMNLEKNGDVVYFN